MTEAMRRGRTEGCIRPSPVDGAGLGRGRSGAHVNDGNPPSISGQGMRLDRTERFYVFRYPGASSRSSVPVDAQWEIRGGQIPQPSKAISRFGGLRDDLPCSSRPPDEHVFGVGRFFVPLRTRMGRFPFLRTWKRLLKNSGCRPKCVKPESSHHRVTRSFYPFPRLLYTSALIAGSF